MQFRRSVVVLRKVNWHIAVGVIILISFNFFEDFYRLLDSIPTYQCTQSCRFSTEENILCNRPFRKKVEFLVNDAHTLKLGFLWVGEDTFSP